MGTWSLDIFGNDLAADVRNAYRDQLANGEQVGDALKAIRRGFAEEMRDADDRRTVWIALAAAQLDAGTVTEDVRKLAVNSIAWCETPGRDAERTPFGAAALAELRERLGGNPPAPKKAMKPNVPPGAGGEVVAVALPNVGGEAVVYVAGPAGNGRGSDTGRVVLLFDLAPDTVTSDSVRAALFVWRRHREAWHDGLGHRCIGCYDASGKLPARRTRLLLREIEMPAAFARRMRFYGETYRSADLPWIVENDVRDWKTRQWAVDPADPEDDA